MLKYLHALSREGRGQNDNQLSSRLRWSGTTFLMWYR